jgi:hypothetical protein
MEPSWYITEDVTLGLNTDAQVLLAELEDELHIMAHQLNKITNK